LAGNLETDSLFENRTHRWYGAGKTIDMGSIMPDMDSLTFLNKLFKYLNIEIYYTDEYKIINLVRSTALSEAIESIEVFNYTEDVEPLTDIVLNFDSDKEQTPGSLALQFPGAMETKEVSLGFSRTLFNFCYRLFKNNVVKIPVLWSSLNPFADLFREAYEIPQADTKGNLRLLEYKGKKTGVSYTQTYGGSTTISQETATTFAEFAEPDILPLHADDYASEPVMITARAALNASQVQKMYDQTWFKSPIALTRKGEKLATGRLIEARQLNANVYELKLRRV
jgi:hypothetical protein